MHSCGLVWQDAKEMEAGYCRCCLRQQPKLLLHTFLFIQPNSYYIIVMLREAVFTRIKKFSLVILIHNLHTMCVAALSIMPVFPALS